MVRLQPIAEGQLISVGSTLVVWFMSVGGELIIP